MNGSPTWKQTTNYLVVEPSPETFTRLQPNTTGMTDDEALAWANVIAKTVEDGEDAAMVNEVACLRLRRCDKAREKRMARIALSEFGARGGGKL
jgi:hypothetical protein